jgi:Spy/CpxP family protein refolding chaperone
MVFNIYTESYKHKKLGMLAFILALAFSISIIVPGFIQLSYSQDMMHNNKNNKHTIDDNNNTTLLMMNVSKYAGEEKSREIKSLSYEDIQSLQNGTGNAFGGMAKLAELNGYPGPRHVLDLANKLNLTSSQKSNITDIYNDMKERSQKLGTQIINIERTANEAFANNKSISDRDLKQLIMKSADIYGQLRYTHLSTHLKMMDILNPEQIDLYNQLRGYYSIRNDHSH